MKATGIIKRVDDLGRIQIPRELRRTMTIREGDPMEFYTMNDKIVLVPYNPDTDTRHAIEKLQKFIMFEDSNHKEELLAKIEEMKSILN